MITEINTIFKKMDYGLLFFTPNIYNCCYTMALEAMDFIDLYSRNIYPERKTLSEECPRYCINEKQLNLYILIFP